MTDETVDVAIIGAGPYGLSAAAALSGRRVRVFGRTASFWSDHMPQGMFLRSPRRASSLVGPGRPLGLERYEREHSIPPQAPLPLSTFVDYLTWFQARAVPDVDPRLVHMVDRAHGGGFRLTLADGEELSAHRVVVAAGIESFAARPDLFRGLSPDLASHTVDHPDLRTFAGSNVAVVGAGQSAIESAALLSEAGCAVEVIARTHAINWLVRSKKLHALRPIRPLLYGPSDIGPAGVSWLVEWPRVFSRFPRETQVRLAARAIRPAAAAWLLPRTSAVRTSMGRSIVSVSPSGTGLSVSLDDGTSRRVDHVLLATGYRVDVSRYPFLHPSLLDAIDRVRGFPRLGPGFESSVSGLHFIGAPAAWSYGPLFRFVAGTPWAARDLRRVVAAAPPPAQRTAVSVRRNGRG